MFAGFEIVHSIEECSCQNTLCFRADHFESVSELVDEPSINNTTTQKKRREKVHYTLELDICKQLHDLLEIRQCPLDAINALKMAVKLQETVGIRV